ncbi:MAG: hypothetical protein P3B98_05675 [Gemmatimonadota bacterium]|nr:hypothetical protein [Gemmatimonadota bacterium]
MSTPEKDTVENVEKLLAERRKVSGWLSALAGRKSDTSAVVYQRVHDDYTAKLDKVQAKLVAASDAVQVAAADLAGRLTDKEESVAAKRDERSEAELRALVGEYSEREWDKRRARLDEELAAATTERDALREELARLRTVLAEVSAAPGQADEAPDEPTPAPVTPDIEALQTSQDETSAADAGTVDAALAGDVSPAESPLDAPVSDGAANDGTANDGTANDGTANDGTAAPAAEFADASLASIAEFVDEGAPAETGTDALVDGSLEVTAENRVPDEALPSALAEGDVPALDASSAPTPIVPTQAVVQSAPIIPIHEQLISAPVDSSAPLAPSFDELAFLKSVVGRPTPAANVPMNEPFTGPKAAPAPRPSPYEPEAPPARDARSYAMPEPPIAFPDPVPEPRVSQEMTPPRESFFGRPTPRTSEAVKSLRCQECGTLNYPTEWYCERCGGELAAL